MFVGIEIGGTKLQLAAGEGEGKLQGSWRQAVDPKAGPEAIRWQIVRGVPELLKRANLDRNQIQGAGIGFGGPVDEGTQSIIKSHQIDGWDGFPLAQWISDQIGLPAILGNDADVAGLAEALFGAGEGLSPIFYVTVGSGIGGGLIIEGEIYRGTGRGAAEIGHLQIERLWDGQRRWLPVEEYASGWAIAVRACERIGKGEGSRSPLKLLLERHDGQLSAKEVAKAAAQGDPFALDILEEALDALAEGLNHVITLLCPRRIVIGGGISLIGEELFFSPLRKKVADRAFRPFAECYDIVPAALGEEVVLHGALALAKQAFVKSRGA
jgi:glucokinase